LYKGSLAEVEGQILKSEEYFTGLINKFPNWEGSYLQLAHFYTRYGRFDKAKEVYTKGIKSLKKKDGLLSDLSDLYISLEEFDHARETYEQLFDLLPFSIKVQMSLGSTYFFERDFSQAEKIYKHLSDDLFLKPFKKWRVNILTMLGDITFIIRGPVAANIIYREAVSEMSDSDYQAYLFKLPHRLGLVAQSMGDLNEAIRMYNDQLYKGQLQSTFIWSLVFLGLAYMDQGEVDKAKEVWQRFDRYYVYPRDRLKQEFGLDIDDIKYPYFFHGSSPSLRPTLSPSTRG
jgi:tetratricopeptide (TPR) repeat protein